jgi:uncharacterized sulfatase
MKIDLRLPKTALFVLLFLQNCFYTNAQSKPNIVWIITEDISPELGCYDYPFVQTTNLDRLATEGLRFTRMFSTAPVCSPSRSAMITGMYQTSIGAQNHRSHRNDGYKLPEPVKPITSYLRHAGYFVCNGQMNADSIKGPGKTDYNFNLDKPFDGYDWRQRRDGQPFFAEIQIGVTHRGPVWKTDVQKHQPQIEPDQLKLPPYYPDHPVAREDWATYLESIQLMDAYVGVILKRLEREGLLHNTLIIFSSDHGRCHVRDKQFLYDGGILIPCIMRWPQHFKAGSVNSDLVSTIDISATILQVADIQPPTYMEGRPIFDSKAQKREYIIAARDRMDETIDKMRAVRTKRFKYIKNYMPQWPYMQPNQYKETEYPVWNLLKELKAQNKLTPAQALFTAETKPPEELYDIQKDPFELHNLAGEKQYQKILVKMRKMLDHWIKATNDQGQYPEKPESISK